MPLNPWDFTAINLNVVNLTQHLLQVCKVVGSDFKVDPAQQILANSSGIIGQFPVGGALENRWDWVVLKDLTLLLYYQTYVQVTNKIGVASPRKAYAEFGYYCSQSTPVRPLPVRSHRAWTTLLLHPRHRFLPAIHWL